MNFNNFIREVPKYSETWTIDDVKAWLKHINCDEYIE